MDGTHQQDAIIPASSVSEPSPATSSQRKRILVSSPANSATEVAENRRKAPKVSRACDLCKVKKARCSGTRPCNNCTNKGFRCMYNAEYKRGRPPTPPLGRSVEVVERLGVDTYMRTPSATTQGSVAVRPMEVERASTIPVDSGPSRASPDLEMAEIEGQYFDPTSGLTFLHRAWRRLSAQRGQAVPDLLNGAEKSQRLMNAGDKPFHVNNEGAVPIPDRNTAMELMTFYFDVCVVTYRFLHRQTVASWLEAVLGNAGHNLPISHGLGHAKVAAVFTIFAIVTLRQEKLRNSLDDGAWSLQSSDEFFCAASSLTEAETGLPRLESAQARLLQVLYLLQTTRMNQAWYVFGNTLQIISALGLHRQAGRKRNSTIVKSAPSDYIHAQCRKRTFWVAYTIDRYLSVVLGRPRHHHDDDIDQDFPDLVNDEDMTPDGPSTCEPQEDCHVEALILHAKLAQIIGRTSHDVYATTTTTTHLSTSSRIAAAHRLGADLAAWRSALPPHLGPAIRPKTLSPPFRRQAAALKLAHAHAVMHAGRPFLLGRRGLDGEGVGGVVEECLGAARTALEAVDGMAEDGECFHAFWWTGYVTFVALAVVYVWEIQRRTMGEGERGLGGLGELAERCQRRLAMATVADSPNRRYGVILEELRLEARQLAVRGGGGEAQMGEAGCNGASDGDAAVRQSGFDGGESMVLGDVLSGQSDAGLYGVQNPLGEWETTDWLDLDSSAFEPFLDFSGSPAL